MLLRLWPAVGDGSILSWRKNPKNPGFLKGSITFVK